MAGPEVEFSVEEEALPDGVHIVSVRGEVDAATASRLEEVLLRAAAAGALRLVVDLRRVGFIDSAGFTALARALDELKARRGKLSVVCEPRLAGLFEVLDLDEHFQVTVSVEDGVRRAQEQQSLTSMPTLQLDQPWREPLRHAREVIQSGLVPPDDEELRLLRLALDENAGGES
jgi:anti-anti-sigma factor